MYFVVQVSCRNCCYSAITCGCIPPGQPPPSVRKQLLRTCCGVLHAPDWSSTLLVAVQRAWLEDLLWAGLIRLSSHLTLTALSLPEHSTDNALRERETRRARFPPPVLSPPHPLFPPLSQRGAVFPFPPLSSPALQRRCRQEHAYHINVALCFL